MNAEQQAIIREIVAKPDDDVPRLIYADWLEDCGDEQGEFIRVQCELARGCKPPRQAKLHQREQELLLAHRAEWVERVSPGVLWHQFARGLVEDVVVSSDQFFQTGGELLANSPLLGLGLKLANLTQAQQLADLPTFGQLLRLRLGDSVLGSAGLEILAESPHFPRLRGLWLSRCQVALAGLRALADSRAMTQLETLVLNGNPLSDGAIVLLAQCSDFASLATLSINDCAFGDEGGWALVNSPHLTKLRRINFHTSLMNLRTRERLWERFRH